MWAVMNVFHTIASSPKFALRRNCKHGILCQARLGGTFSQSTPMSKELHCLGGFTGVHLGTMYECAHWSMRLWCSGDIITVW